MAEVTSQLTDPQSVDVIMNSVANELEGMADLFCNQLVTTLQDLAGATPTISSVQTQVSALKGIFCGYTAKESAIASVIKSTTKKSAADIGINPNLICSCSNYSCHR